MFSFSVTVITFYKQLFITNLKFVLNFNLTTPYGTLFIWHLLNEPNDIKMQKDPSQSVFLPQKTFSWLSYQCLWAVWLLQTSTKKTLLFSSGIYVTGANKYSQFSDRNPAKPELQFSRLYQGRGHPRTLKGRICFPPMDS